MTREILTDRDVAFCIGATSQGHAILAPEWADLATLLGVVLKACRPYRAKTKGKVERMIRELKESFLPWLSRQLLPPSPTLADYDALPGAGSRRWCSDAATGPPNESSASPGQTSDCCSGRFPSACSPSTPRT